MSSYLMLQQSTAWRKWLMGITRKYYFSFAELRWHWLFKDICGRGATEVNTSQRHNKAEGCCLHNACSWPLKKGRFGALFLDMTTQSTRLILYLHNNLAYFMNVQYWHQMKSFSDLRSQLNPFFSCIEYFIF